MRVSPKTRRFITWGIVGLLPFGVLWGAIVIRPRDRFEFLRPGEVVWTAYTMGGSHSAKEFRMYTLKQPWEEVVHRASSELKRNGFADKTNPKWATFMSRWTLNEAREGRPAFEGTDYEIAVELELGRHHPGVTESDGDPQWVTVFISKRVEETWLHVIRANLFSLDRK